MWLECATEEWQSIGGWILPASNYENAHQKFTEQAVIVGGGGIALSPNRKLPDEFLDAGSRIGERHY
jgi:hypothetical protein